LGQNVSAQNEKPTKTILFVCEHGAAKSPIAAAYFNKLAKEKGLNYQAVFKGTNPDSVLAVSAKNGLLSDNFDTSAWYPKLVSNQDLLAAEKIVTFDCQLPAGEGVSAPVENWTGISSVSEDYNLARKEIVDKVNQLVAQLIKNN
jgi:arsenate reductase (thioredoxin)